MEGSSRNNSSGQPFKELKSSEDSASPETEGNKCGKDLEISENKISTFPKRDSKPVEGEPTDGEAVTLEPKKQQETMKEGLPEASGGDEKETSLMSKPAEGTKTPEIPEIATKELKSQDEDYDNALKEDDDSHPNIITTDNASDLMEDISDQENEIVDDSKVTSVNPEQSKIISDVESESNAALRSDASKPGPIDTSSDEQPGDIQAVSSFYKLDPQVFRSLSPSVVRNISAKFNDFQNLQSANQIYEVKLEQLTHSARSKVESLAAKMHASEDKIQLLEQEATKITDIKNAEKEGLVKEHNKAEGYKQTIARLKVQVQQYSEFKQGTNQMLSDKQERILELTKELEAEAEIEKKLRMKINEMEDAKDLQESQITQEKFDKAKFQRELDLSQQSVKWYEAELDKRSTELQSVRNSTRTEIARLRAHVDNAKQDQSVAISGKMQLETSLQALQSKYEKSMLRIKELSDEKAQQDHLYKEELAKKEKLLTVLQKSNDARGKRIESIQKAYDETIHKIDEDEDSYKTKFEGFKNDMAKREARIKDLEDTINDMSTTNIENTVSNENILGVLSEEVSGDESNSVSKSSNATLSTSAKMVLKDSKYSLTDILTQVSKLRRNLVRERRAKEKAEKELYSIFKELDRRLPLLKSYKEKCTTLEMKQGQFEVILDNLSKEKSMLRTQLTISSKKADELQLQVRQLSQFKVDLQRQLAVLLSELTVNDHGGALTDEEKAYITHLVGDIPDVQDSTDTGNLITERLTTFKDIAELITRNEQLLVASRNLGMELEAKEKSGTAELQQSENQALIKSKKAILKLQEQLQSTKTQLAAASNSRDILQKLIESNVQNPFQNGDEKAVKEKMDSCVLKLSEKEKEYDALRKEYDTKIFELNGKIQQVIAEKSDLSLELAKMQSSNELLKEKVNTSSYFSASAKAENSQLKSNMSSLQEKQSELEQRTSKLTDELLHSKSSQASLEIQLKTIKAEKSIWEAANGKLHSELEKITDEKRKANALVIRLQTLDSERQEQYKSTLQRLHGNVDRLQAQLDTVRQRLSSSVEETKRILHSKNADSKSYQERIDQLMSQVSSLQETLNSKSQSLMLLNENYESLRNKYDEVTERRKANLSSIEASDTSNGDMVAALKQELNNALEDSKLAAQNSVQYKQIAASSEKELNLLNDSFNKYKVSTEKQLLDARKNIESLTSQITELQKEKAELQKHLQETTDEYSGEHRQSEEKIQELQKAVEAFESIKGDYETRLEGLKKEITEKDRRLKNAVTQEANNTEVKQKISEERDSFAKKLDVLQTEMSGLKSKLQETEASLESVNTSFGKEKSDFEEQLKRDQIRITELDCQNRTLINQLESNSLEDASPIGDETNDTKGLIGYLHRENDSLSQQLQYSKAEEKRLRSSVTSKDSELSSLKAQLVEAKENVSVADKYTTLLANMKKESHELQVFKDNNISLRAQLQALLKKTKDLESKLAVVSSSTEPIKKELAQLRLQLSSKNSELEKAHAQLKELSLKFDKSSATVTNKENEIEELTKQKNNLLQQVADLQNAKSGPSKDKEQLKLYQVEIARLNKEVSDLNSSLTSVKQELSKKVEEAKKQARLAKFAPEPINGSPSADSVKEEFKKKIYAKELESYKKKLEQEKEEYMKKIEAERDEFKKQVENESKHRLNEEMDAYKKRVRAPTNARISEVIEQRWKARSAQLDAQYEAKVKELEDKSKQQAASQNVGLSDVERNKMRKDLEREKEEIRQEVTASVKKETQFRENILKRQLDNLKEKVKNLEANKTSAGKNAESALLPAASSSSKSPFSFLSSHHNAEGGVSNLGLHSNTAESNISSSFGNVTLPTKPMKRKSDDGDSNVEKRPKTD